MQPRAQHYVFAHRFLAALALNQPSRLLSLMRGDAQAALERLWRRCGTETRSNLAPTGLAARLYRLRGHDLALVRLPAALGESEAHFLSALFSGGSHFLPLSSRVFTLEASGTSAPHPGTMLGEWDRQGHRCHGDGPMPDAGAFLHAVEDLAFVTACVAK
jgi:hypothetical protein